MLNLLSTSFDLSRVESSNQDIEMGIQGTTPAELGLEGFLKQGNDIEKETQKLTNLLKRLEDANEESKHVTNAAKMKDIKQRMEKDINEVLKVARITKTKLEELDNDNLKSREKPGSGKGSTVDRSRTATTLGLKKKLKERMSEFQSLRERIQQEHREVVERRVFTVTGTHPDEETIDRLIETGNSEQIFQKAIQEHGRGQVLDTLAEIQERHDAVKEVEKGLLQLQQIFLDLSVLVEAQGDLLDNIEEHVTKATDHVQSGVGQLQKARRLQKNTRKWTFFAIILLLIIIAIVVLTVIKPWSK